MKAELLTTNTPELFQSAVNRAVDLLRAGQLVVLPTETVYGLAANALDDAAVARIYEAKGRPAHNPIIVHVADLAMAQQCAASWPLAASRLADAFWPGPLTLVLPKSERIPAIVTAEGPTVGIRWPSHPFIQAVIKAAGFPLAAPSANPSNQLSPTTVNHVWRTLADRVPLMVDGGPAQVGIESTVLDLTSTPCRILRPGMIHAESIIAVLPDHTLAGTPTADQAGILRSPGMLKKHYSPKAKLVVLDWKDDSHLLAQIAAFGVPPAQVHLLAHSKTPDGQKLGPISLMPHEPSAYARALYAELHRCDEAGAALIVVQAPPPSSAWRGVADRLARAAAS